MSLKDIQSDTATTATPSQLDRIRTPQQIYSAGYLDDPIQFKPDSRFEPKTVVQQFFEIENQIKRDFADFLQVDKNNDAPQSLVVNMFSPLMDRISYQKVILPRTSFTQLGVTR